MTTSKYKFGMILIMKKPLKIVIIIAVVVIPTILIAGFTNLSQGRTFVGTRENQVYFIESHGPIEELYTYPSGVQAWRFIEGPFWPFYAAQEENGLALGVMKSVYITKIPGDIYSGSTFIMFYTVVDTEANIKSLFKIDNLYLMNGSARVFYSKDPFDTRGTYTVLFNVEGTWYLNSRGSDACMDNIQSFVDLPTFLSNIVLQVNNGFFYYPR